MVALHGETGRELWTRDTDAVYTHFRSFSDKCGEMLRPVALRRARGRHRAGVYLPGGDGKLIVLDADGESRERAVRHPPQAGGLRACDVDGDGVDEIVLADQSNVYVVPADALDAPRWKRPLNSTGQRQILEIVPADGKQPPLIALATDPTDNRFWALTPPPDARSGPAPVRFRET